MKDHKKAYRRMRVYLVAVIGLLVSLTYIIVNYWPKIFSNYKEQALLEKQYTELLEEEEVLTDNITKLNDPDYVTRYAREKYLYSKEGEIIIRMVE